MKTTMVTRTVAALAAVGALFAAMLLLSGGASAAPTYPPPTSSAPGGIQVSDTTPQPGETITVSGQGCQANTPLTVFFDSTQIGSGTTDANGSFSISVTIPSDASPGHHTISVTGANCPGSNVLGIEVVAPSSASGGGGTLAGTGVAVVGIGALGVVLLAGGAMMLMAGRRRRHV